MDVHFAAPELSDLDALRCEAIALPFFSDERPLQGAGGLIDWRLCGALSRILVSGFVTGGLGEQVLVPTQSRLAVEKVFLFGLGPEAAMSIDVAAGRIRHILQTVLASGSRTLAMVLPGRSTGIMGGVAAMEAFVLAAGPPFRGQGSAVDEVILIESPDGQREMAPVVERERRRARAMAGSQ